MRTKLLVTICLSLAVVGCGDDEETGQPETPSERVVSLRLGESVMLRNESGETLRAKVTQVFDPVRGHQFEGAKIAGRYVGVELALANDGDIPHRGSPWSGSSLATTKGNERPTKLLKQGMCLGTVRRVIPPGARERFCIPFRVDPGAKLLKFRYTPDAGFAPATGEWDLRTRASGRG